MNAGPFPRKAVSRLSCLGLAGWLTILCGAVTVSPGLGYRVQGAGALEAGDTAERAMGVVGSRRGVCVVLGDSEGAIIRELAARNEWILYAQLPDAKQVEAARRAAEAAGWYGTRVFIERGELSRLHLADNLADVVIGAGDAAGVSEAEVLRVLRPEGRALLGERTLTKPFPRGVDDWSHPYHGPDNNPVSEDRVARAPYWTQFLADPRYAPLPQVAVASAGRVFKLFGHIAFKEREEPWLNTLAAFNGFNGEFLWRRPVTPGLMIHRNTLVATPTRVYVADDRSCKVIEAATGVLKDEIAPPAADAGGTFWKWMAIEDGVLYALIGDDEQRDPVIRMRSNNHGWPWDPLSPGFNQAENPWGYGRTLLAIDPATKRVLWRHREAEAVDSRALCMAAGRLFLFRQGAFLVCLNARDGKEQWRRTLANEPELAEAFGPGLNRQDWRTNWRTTAYAKCTDQALYFSGPTVSKLLALSAVDGRVLWQHPYNNYQVVLLDDGLYALSGQIDEEVSRRFDPLTGKVLSEVNLGRRACTRPTGTSDAVFCRANGGSTRWEVGTGQVQLISPMRAQCQDGVTIANGLLYWWPSVCDCNLTLYGITCLGPAGAFDFSQAGSDAERLEDCDPGGSPMAELVVSPQDWPTFRADNAGSATTGAEVSDVSRPLWSYRGRPGVMPTAPTAAGGLVFLGGSDGIVRALDAVSGRSVWTAFTGGNIRFPPTVWQGRALVGSGDGCVHAFEASTGRLLWRFRAAPIERRIPVYGQLQSTWPVASGVLVQDGVAYAAAGIVNYDGTHVYALDAATGRIRWQNNNSGHLDATACAGVSVQGHMILHEGKLWLAGGNVVSPGVYSMATGECLNDVAQVHQVEDNNVPSSTGPRGAELYLVANQVRVSGQPHYAHPEYKVCDPSVTDKTWVASRGDRDFLWVSNARSSKVLCYPRIVEKRDERLGNAWGKPQIRGMTAHWDVEATDSAAVALCRNALVINRGLELAALRLQDGQPLWVQKLPGLPVPWGLAVDADGRVVVALRGGEVVCYGSGRMTASR
ncbi:MAG TPA: PQQ-binding-like beta-propeller repeat protein [Verrucomicrobiota bacterium]|nr:PQQ-binding-like beta-propeller repeat protein [Verrucomicrobiota bacterium]HNU49786.1 PQQ-binding-like beta-propeller repeat protein [Verrucomicrobiota bacterium]